MQLARKQGTSFAPILQLKDDTGNCKMWTRETYFKIMGILSALPLLLGETLDSFGRPSELSDRKTREDMGPHAMAWTAVLDAIVLGRPRQKPHSYHNTIAFSFRKNQLSVEHNQRRLLRCCFLAWQRWSQAETEKRELQIKREETKRKMAQLLEAVSLGKSRLDRPLEVDKPGTAAVNHHQDLQQDQVNPSLVVYRTHVICWHLSIPTKHLVCAIWNKRVHCPRVRLLSQGDPQIPSCSCSGEKSLKIGGKHEGQWMSFKNNL